MPYLAITECGFYLFSIRRKGRSSVETSISRHRRTFKHYGESVEVFLIRWQEYEEAKRWIRRDAKTFFRGCRGKLLYS